jgi:capsular polysaccharide biosynthesis protein
MFNFIVGFILGIVVATVGFSGVVKALDNGIETVKNVSVKVDTGK